MATYLELFSLKTDSDLQDKVAVAVAVKAQTLISSGTLTTNAKAWVNETLSNPKSKADSIINYVLATNKALTTAQIKAAEDSAIQTVVNAAVDALIA